MTVCMFCACSVKHDATPTHTTTQPKMHGQTSIYNAHVDMYETATPTATVRYKFVTYTRLNNAVAQQQGFKQTRGQSHTILFLKFSLKDRNIIYDEFFLLSPMKEVKTLRRPGAVFLDDKDLLCQCCCIIS